MIGSAPKVEGIPRFALNNDRGGALAVEYLSSLGHKHIAVIKGHPWRNAAKQRFASIVKAMKAHGITIDERLVQELHSGNMPRELTMPEEGYKCGVELLATKLPFSALICFNDVTAIGAIRAFREAGLRVPEDVSVIGFDDIESAGYLTPSLTTLRQPLEQMGELAADHLIAIINDGAQPLSEVLVDPTLIERESTAPYKPRKR